MATRRTESSPLLERPGDSEALASQGLALDKPPTIMELERHLYSKLPLFTSPSTIQNAMERFPAIPRTQRDSFSMLLALRRISGQFLKSHRNVPLWAFTPAPKVEHFATDIWNAIASLESDAELDEVIWKAFVLKDSTSPGQEHQLGA